MRPVNVIIGAAAAALAIYIMAESAPRRTVIEVLPDGGAIVDGGMILSADAGMSSSASAINADAAVGVDDLPMPTSMNLGGLDAGFVPMLAAGSPKGARLGIVLIAYSGAEVLPGQSGPKRSKAEAKALADRLAEDAKTDFHGAVQRGDSGSGDDLGRFNQTDLDPATAYAIFSLPVGGVSAVVDTPRGFWIAKRID